MRRGPRYSAQHRANASQIYDLFLAFLGEIASVVCDSVKGGLCTQNLFFFISQNDGTLSPSAMLFSAQPGTRLAAICNSNSVMQHHLSHNQQVAIDLSSDHYSSKCKAVTASGHRMRYVLCTCVIARCQSVAHFMSAVRDRPRV